MTEEYLIKVVNESIINKDYLSAISFIKLKISLQKLPKNFDDKVINVICIYFKMTKFELIKPTRKRENVDARKMVSKILRDKNYTFSHIGKKLGKKDHSSIVYYCKNANNLIKTDKVFKNAYENILEIVNQKN